MKSVAIGDTLHFFGCQMDVLGEFLDVLEDTLFEIWVSKDTFGSKIHPPRCQFYGFVISTNEWRQFSNVTTHYLIFLQNN